MTAFDFRSSPYITPVPTGDGYGTTVRLAVAGLQAGDLCIFPLPGVASGVRYRIESIGPQDGPGRDVYLVQAPRTMREIMDEDYRRKASGMHETGVLT